MDTSALQSLLTLDPLEEAEKITGKSYKTDNNTEVLGLGLALAHNRVKEGILTERGDTSFSCGILDFRRIAEEEGMELAQSFAFVGESSSAYKETFFVYGCRERGLILLLETYGGTRVNKAKLHYCIRPTSTEAVYNLQGSGRYESETHPDWRRDPAFNNTRPEDLYWSGDIDCREAFRHKLRLLEEAGTPLPVWPKPSQGDRKSGLHLVTYSDWKRPEANGDFKSTQLFLSSLLKERLDQLPDWAKAIIGQP